MMKHVKLRKKFTTLLFVLISVFFVSQTDAQNTDTDGDTVIDTDDFDDDNDGILDTNECFVSNFYWSNAPVVSGNTATGTINGIGYTYTSSQPVETTTDMYEQYRFPASYAVPNLNPTIKNTLVTNNGIVFDSPMTNPVLVFSSIGNPFTPVPIIFGEPVEILWSQDVVQNSATQITGSEGFAIIRMNGTFSSITFNYTAPEIYVNFSFGADFITYCDTDTDGLNDILDYDSDNDGCPDVDEVYGSGTDTDGNGYYGSGIPAVDGNGLVIAAGVSGTSYILLPPDNDTNGTEDFLQTSLVLTGNITTQPT
jgi:hypothetical protein